MEPCRLTLELWKLILGQQNNKYLTGIHPNIQSWKWMCLGICIKTEKKIKCIMKKVVPYFLNRQFSMARYRHAPGIQDTGYALCIHIRRGLLCWAWEGFIPPCDALLWHLHLLSNNLSIIFQKDQIKLITKEVLLLTVVYWDQWLEWKIKTKTTFL